MQDKQEKRIRRHRRLRAKIKGSAECPRLAVFRSNQHIYAQLIDDEKGKTIIGLNDFKIKNKKKMNKVEIAKEIGNLIAKQALAKKINKAVFDRGGFKYHGRVKAVAEGARQGGLKF